MTRAIDLGALFGKLRRQRPRSFGGVAVVPLVTDDARPAPYASLARALDGGTARVGEDPRGADVNQVVVLNEGERPLLVRDGEELVGAKQNRVAAATVLVPPRKAASVPVVCVEAGRWHYSRPRPSPAPPPSRPPAVDAELLGDGERIAAERWEAWSRAAHRHFESGDAAEAASVRRRRVSVSTRRSDARRVAPDEQATTWREVASLLADVGVGSATSSIRDAYDSRREQLAAYAAALGPKPGEVGAIYVVGNEVSGLEVFDSPEAFAEVAPRLVRSHAIEAMRGRAAREVAEERVADAARAFHRRIVEAEARLSPSVGLGEDLRIGGASGVAGCGLVHEGRLVHAAVFPA